VDQNTFCHLTRGHLKVAATLLHGLRNVVGYFSAGPTPGSEATMGYYALFYHVVDGFVERRLPFRQPHLAHARHAAERGELALGGALAEPADTALIVFRGDSPNAARAFAEKDPYVRNGLVQRWEVRPWNVVVGTDANSSNAAASRGVS
jgi:uncharacterized protein YciI